MEKISIIGAGNIGKAIGDLLRNNNKNVEFWDEDFSKVSG